MRVYSGGGLVARSTIWVRKWLDFWSCMMRRDSRFGIERNGSFFHRGSLMRRLIVGRKRRERSILTHRGNNG